MIVEPNLKGRKLRRTISGFLFILLLTNVLVIFDLRPVMAEWWDLEVAVAPQNPGVSDPVNVTVSFTFATEPPFVEEFGSVERSGNVFSTNVTVYLPAPWEHILMWVHTDSYTHSLSNLSAGEYEFQIYVQTIHWHEGYWLEETVPFAVTIIVPHDYATIQEAVNAASDGDRIFVKSGTYHKKVIVNKTVSLTGENKSDTIVESRGDIVFEISAKGAELSEFTIVGTSTNLTKITNYGAIVYSEDSYVHDNIFINSNGVVGIYVCRDNNLIMHNLFKGSGKWTAMEILQSRYCDVIGNRIDGGYYGIDIVNGIVHPGGHTICSNTITGVSYRALWLYNSGNNTIIANNFSYCRYGISLRRCNSTLYPNRFEKNRISYNSVGLRTYHSERQIFYHNNFINNTRQIYDFSWDDWAPASINIWDSRCEGNFWSDYNGTDLNREGIGDEPYTIDGNNSDRYPLMNLYWNPCDINHDLKVEMEDVAKAAIAFDAEPGHPRWNVHADITGPEYLAPDNKVDMRDIGLIARNFGEAYS